MAYINDTKEMPAVDEDVIEQNGAGLKEESAQDGYTFDFSKITAADANKFRQLTLRLEISKSVETIAPSMVNPPDGIDNPGQMRFMELTKIKNEFLMASRKYEGDAVDLVRFDVEDIVGDDVEGFVLAAHNGQVDKQIEIMERYVKSRHNSAKDLMVLDYKLYMNIRNTFMDALLDLTKN